MAMKVFGCRYPGPWLSRLTSLPLIWHDIQGTRETFIDNLHRKYGDLVQIAPRTLSVNDADSVRKIFGPGSRLDRPSELVPFHNFGAENLVSTESGSLHQARRKCVRSPYNKKRTEADDVQSMMEAALRGLPDYLDSNMRTQGHVDAQLIFRYVTANFMSRFVYGQKHDLNLFQDDSMRDRFQKDINWQDERMKTISTLLQYLYPSLLSPLQNIKWLPAWLRGPTPENLVLNKVGSQAIEQHKTNSPEQKKSPNEHDTVINRLLDAFETEGPTRAIPNDSYILSDSMDHFWAGVSTTADVLTSIIRHLSTPSNADLQHRLRTTLQSANAHTLPTLPILTARKIPILDSIIRETLRTDPPAPFSMERKASADHPGTLQGYPIEAGMTVGAQSCSFHRNGAVFPEPEKWLPERWDMPGDSEMRRHFFAFGLGPRMCLGMNVAWAQMVVYLAWVYSRYETSLAETLQGEQGVERRRLVVFRRLEET